MLNHFSVYVKILIMKKDVFNNLNTTNCETFKRKESIDGLLLDSLKSSNEVYIRLKSKAPSKKKDKKKKQAEKAGPRPVDLVRFAEVTEDFIIFEKIDKNRLTFEIDKDDTIEVIIHEPMISYYFMVKIEKFKPTTSTFLFKTPHPTQIIKITRRDFFRYEPPARDPLHIEFTHLGVSYSTLTHAMSLKDISGGGFSLKVFPEQDYNFNMKDEIKNIKFIFDDRVIKFFTAEVVFLKDETVFGKVYHNVGMQFVDIIMPVQDQLVKALFNEHRKLLKKQQQI